MKRGFDEVESTPPVRAALDPYTGTRGLEICKIILFYGFDRMMDISMFASISKELYRWANEHVIQRVTTIVFVKQVSFKPFQLIECKRPFPRESLLKYHKHLLVKRVVFDPPISRIVIEECSLTVFANDYPLVYVRFGREDNHYHYTIFEHAHWLGSTIEKGENEGDRVKTLRFLVHLNKNETAKL